jgi:hypothetical protein
VGKKKTIKAHHSIIHTSRDAPESVPKEAPNSKAQEAPMLSPIRVRPNKKIDKLDKMSRLNYAKVYNVEHNVKVYDFGVVHEGYMGILSHQFNTVWGLQVPTATPTNAAADEDDNGEEDEEDEDEDDEDSSDDGDDDNQAKKAHIQIREPEARQRRESSSKGKERSRSRGKEEKKKKVGFLGLLASPKEPRKRRGSGK